ncbi:enoyl-CoA hydratase [Ramlibacter sp. WS9]|uniref:enoyl-CoA hydratase n=1 Tax=Ramlibacter sp. WS9 TaxID=1882741 RepID=UPI0011434BE7|nr:enoyl-CoA hydratase [Ramlibacter sp. WS9]ROZ79400.1 enoyl-CoA hydratase [Ramlibacter sp. WS9]
MDYQCILYSVCGPVARISHNRPDARNAESQALLDEMDDALCRAAEDAAVRTIVLTGEGDHFSAGHDLKEAAQKRSNFTVEERWAYETRYYFDYAMRIWDCPKPTIAEVSGACVAGGFMVANMCDLVVASPDAFFSDPVCQSLGTAAVEVLVHPWVMGARKAKEFLFTGGRMTAEQALAVGMVNRVVPRDQLRAAVDALALQIAGGDSFAMMLAKRSINRGLDIQGMRSAMSAHFDAHQLSHLSESFQARRSEGLGQSIQRGKAALA